MKKNDGNFRAKTRHYGFWPQNIIFLSQIQRVTPFHSTHIGGTPCKVSHFIHNLNDMANIHPLAAPLKKIKTR